MAPVSASGMHLLQLSCIRSTKGRSCLAAVKPALPGRLQPLPLARALKVRPCRSTSANNEGGWDWDFLGWFKPKADVQKPVEQGVVTELPPSSPQPGEPQKGKSGLKSSSASELQDGDDSKVQKSSQGTQTDSSPTDWEADQPKPDPFGYLIMVATLLGLLFVTTSVFRYAGNWAHRRKLAREGSGAPFARIEDRDATGDNSEKARAARRAVPTASLDGSSFKDHELEEMRSVGDQMVEAHRNQAITSDASDASQPDPSQQVFIPGRGWVDATEDQQAQQRREEQDGGQVQGEEVDLEDQDEGQSAEDRDEDEDEDNDDAGRVASLADGSAEELSTREVVGLAQDAQRGSQEHVDEASADKGEDGGGESEESSALPAAELSDQPTPVDQQDHGARTRPSDPFERSSIDPRCRSTPDVDIPKDASVRSLRQRATVASRAARSASEASQRAAAYSAAASSAAAKAADAADRAAEAAGRAHSAAVQGMGREVRMFTSRAREAERAATAAERKGASPAAHATAHQEVATAQADLADQAANSPVRRGESWREQGRAKLQDGWYAAKASCSGLAAHLQGWLAAAWQWLLAVWARAVTLAQAAGMKLRQMIPKRTAPAAS